MTAEINEKRSGRKKASTVGGTTGRVEGMSLGAVDLAVDDDIVVLAGVCGIDAGQLPSIDSGEPKTFWVLDPQRVTQQWNCVVAGPSGDGSSLCSPVERGEKSCVTVETNVSEEAGGVTEDVEGIDRHGACGWLLTWQIRKTDRVGLDYVAGADRQLFGAGGAGYR